MILRAIAGLILLPLWVLFMFTVYPLVWIGLRTWEMCGGDGEYLDKWQGMAG